ncbi:hypothetical protein B7P43_G11389 [Cryptotermes secundus]|uniref:Tc1-like transposase DDE domain-containing protein n=1 Tax=Cryptotermes secundus TaxID=105785 RepID=A0A2J7Q315_9NEOP|nr:hypothetical protein B7P43_G11389 [Cryptotermes secundus]
MNKPGAVQFLPREDVTHGRLGKLLATNRRSSVPRCHRYKTAEAMRVVVGQALFTWPTRSPDLTPCDFFLWGYIKDRVYVPPLPRTLVELRERIDAAMMTTDRMMLQNVWNELYYRLDVCRVTQGAHIEHL